MTESVSLGLTLVGLFTLSGLFSAVITFAFFKFMNRE